MGEDGAGEFRVCRFSDWLAIHYSSCLVRGFLDYRMNLVSLLACILDFPINLELSLSLVLGL